MIDGDDEFGRAQCFDFLNKGFELPDVLEVAAEQDNAADRWVEQALFFFFGQTVGGDVCHNGAAREENEGHISETLNIQIRLLLFI